MPRQTKLFPAWMQAEPDRVHAVNRRLGGAITALRDRCHDNSLESLGFDIGLMYDALTRPGLHWQRHVRRSRGGEEKRCFSPSPQLRALQMALAKILLPCFGDTLFPGTAYGKGCSIITNAKFHRRGRSSIRLDLKDAFPSITANQISAMLVRPPGSYEHCTDPECVMCTPMNANLAWIASRLFTRNGRLEQGAPIAPHMFNRMMERFDRDVCSVTGAPIMPTTALSSDIVYTRYADDLVISYVRDVLSVDIELALRTVIAQFGFRVNEYKTQHTSHGVVSCPGVLITDGRMRPNKAYITRLIATWPELGADQRKGHRVYVDTFGKSGRLKVFRDVVPLIPRRRYPHRLS